MIRDYKPSDYQNLKKLLVDVDMYYEPADNEEALFKKTTKFTGTILVYEENGDIIGCVYYIVDPVLEYVMHLCVAAEHRGKGIGRGLIEEVEERIRKTGSKKEPILLLNVENESALGFYEKLGWKPHLNRKYYMMKKNLG